MKAKTIISILLCFILFNSCGRDEDIPREGFSFYITSNVGSFEDSEIVIGGMQNGTFVPTDSIQFDKIEFLSKHYHVNENRWKPNLDKIRRIPSERCYFKIKLSDQREEFIKVYNQNVTMSLLLPSENVFIGDYGELIIAITGTEVTGYAAKEL
ncbi:hypothetical protein [Polaribacter uvawellassae]|uniref:hypothetical protein n=1 Tax=Polaribacter uvawellassae TaxID=3133495 RepID=UPI00321B6219